ncbi:neurensin-1-like [Sinocyclocheilus rhinocerous]|uniref:Neurensin-1-like n=1 Tax=Sinocyclocheilus rhinocerous TaxID=307959 RepID=A0A673IG07_9TELE|nr:PREDICTED: neurensin-1-like [Sinocyclocheilus rhinocerous]
MASCSESCGSGHAVDSGCHVFGVRSYLHHFYEECTASMREQQEDFQGQRSPLRWSSSFWKVSLAVGVVLLSVGLVVMTVGYSIPTRIEAFGEGELLFVDRQAMRHNRSLHICVLVGTGLLTLGGVLMAGGILMSNFSTTPTKQEDSRGERKGGTRVPSAIRSPADPVMKPPSPVSSDGGVSPLARDDKVQQCS